MGKIRFSIPGSNLRYPYPVCKKCCAEMLYWLKSDLLKSCCDLENKVKVIIHVISIVVRIVITLSECLNTNAQSLVSNILNFKLLLNMHD